METTTRLVRTWIAAGGDEEIRATVADVVDGRSSLLNVVQALGEYLTSEDEKLRSRGVEFLSLVIAKCPEDKINRPATTTLTTFYTSRLDDTETVIPALQGLVTLSSLTTFTGENAVGVAQALFTYINMKAHVQSTRYNVLLIMDNLLSKHRGDLKNMGVELLKGYLSLADGEKDPRNLLLTFSMTRVICIEFDILAHIEDFYNIVFCYFPITFKPSANDPYGITSENLKESLQLCVSAHPGFGPMAIPFFLDKLLVGSPQTKKDNLDCMTICFPVYGSAVVSERGRDLWNTLKLEVFQPTDTETEAKALSALRAAITTIYGSSTEAPKQESEYAEGLVKDICEECVSLLSEPEKSQAKPAMKVLASMAHTHPPTARYILSQTIPFLVSLYQSTDEQPNQPQVLSLLGMLVGAFRLSSSAGEGRILLAPYKRSILVVLDSGVKKANTRGPSLDVLNALTVVPDLLGKEELEIIAQEVVDLLNTPGDGKEDEESDTKILDVLINISTTAPDIIDAKALPLLFASLPDRPPPRSSSDRARCRRLLASLTRLCAPAPLFETLVIRLTTKLDLVLTPLRNVGVDPSSNHEVNADEGAIVAYAYAILTVLKDVLERKVAQKDADIPKYVDRLVSPLFTTFITRAIRMGNNPVNAPDEKILTTAGQIITLVVQTVDAEKQKSLSDALVAAYLQGDVQKFVNNRDTLPAGATLQPFAAGAPPAQKSLVVLFSAAVIGLRKEIIPTPADPMALVVNLASWSLNEAESDFERLSVQHAIASIANKNFDSIRGEFQAFADSFWPSEIRDAAKPVRHRKAALQVWVWICKALLIRDFTSASPLVDRLFDMFSDDASLAWEAARGVGSIGSGGEEVLTKRNHGVVKMLYAQKYYNGVFGRLSSGNKTSPPPLQASCTVSLVYLLQSIPQSIFANDMAQIMPLLLRAMLLPDVTIRVDVIKIFLACAAFDSAKAVVSEHASSLVNAMLENAVMQEQTSVALRIASLEYLTAIPGLVRYDILHPEKASVLRKLQVALDDPVRVVRREAVEARSTWFTYRG